MQEENQESPHQILMLNSLGQAASVLPRPWCPWCRTAQELRGNAKFNTEDHNGKESLEVFFFSLSACLAAWPFQSGFALESPFRGAQHQIFIFPEILGLCRFPSSDSSSHQLKVQPHSLNIYLLLWHWQALLRQVSSASYVHLETSPRLKKQRWSHPFPLFQDSQQFLQNDWFVLFFF